MTAAPEIGVAAVNRTRTIRPRVTEAAVTRRSPIAAFALVTALGGTPARAAPVDEAAARVLQRAGCRDCHNPEGVASDTRLVFPEAGAPARALGEAAAELLDLVDRDAPAASRLLRKPTRRLTHEGGQKIAPGSAEEKVLLDWLKALAARPDPGRVTLVLAASGPAPVPTGRGTFRALTAAQYDNTVRDLLGDVTRPGRGFPPEDFVDGFKNQSQGQRPSAALAEAWNAAARRLATDAARAIRAGDRGRLLPCPARARGRVADECLARFVRGFGRRAFRRPLAADELARYLALAGQAKTGDLVERVGLIIEALLQAPTFLFLTDPEDPALRGPARASRLAYFLWNTTPDEALLEAAERGDLDAPEGLERATARLLEDPRAREAMDEFAAQWLRTDRVRASLKDRRQFPQFTPEVAQAMAEETRMFVADLIENDRDFRGLFTARETFVDGDLAALYGLPSPPGGGFTRVAFGDGVDRAGVLGHGSFLAGTSKPAETSPTARGLFIREHFLCQKVPPPPPGVDVNLPPEREGAPRSMRERLAAHVADENCAGCHNLVDPIGFVFERLDAAGRWRDDPAIDTAGAIAGLPGARFSTVRDLGETLAASPLVQQCVTRQVFRYAVGRKETGADAPALSRIFDEFRASGFRFKRLLAAVVRWTELPPTEPRTAITHQERSR